MSDHPALAYVLWHWRVTELPVPEYEARLRSFHAALAASPPQGFLHSTSSAVCGLPWANGGRDAVEDWYHISDSAALDQLDRAVLQGQREQAHARAAAGAAGGIAGLYAVRMGEPLPVAAQAVWLSRPPGMSYDDFFRLIGPRVMDTRGVLWMRRLVLGPPAEFCIQSATAIELPEPCRGIASELRSSWQPAAVES